MPNTKVDENGLPILRLSWTMLTRLEGCVKQAKLFSEGKRDKSLRQSKNFLRGTALDLAQRAWLEHPDPASVHIRDFVIDKFEAQEAEDGDTLKWKNTEERESFIQDVLKGADALEPWLLENVIPYEYQPEARGTVTLKMLDFNGVKRTVEMFYAMDIVVKKPEGWWLIDLKTTKNKYYVQGKTLGQLTYYSLAWAIVSGIPVTEIHKASFITPLVEGKFETEVKPTQEDFAVMLQRIQKYAWIFWNENYSPTKKVVDYECQFQCEVRKHCPLGQAPQPIEGRTFDFMSVVEQRRVLGEKNDS